MGSSSSALTCSSLSDFAAKSKIPPKFGFAGGEIGEQVADGVDAFCFHVQCFVMAISINLALYPTGIEDGQCAATNRRAEQSRGHAIYFLSPNIDPAMTHGTSRTPYLIAGTALVAVALIVSGIAPHDRLTWFLEIAPILIAAPVLFGTYKRFPLTDLLYVLIIVHALVLIVGAAYSYAHVPAGFWVQEMFHLSRNPYDKLGHFMQGLMPALVAREILLRMGYLTSHRMTAFLSICVALAVSAVYELIEWWAALWLGQGADEFLGMQGDPWDTQSDMFYAMLGAMAALFLLSKIHDRQMLKRKEKTDAS